MQALVDGRHAEAAARRRHVGHRRPLVAVRVVALHRREVRLAVEASGCVDEAAVDGHGEVAARRRHRGARLPCLRRLVEALHVAHHAMAVEAAQRQEGGARRALQRRQPQARARHQQRRRQAPRPVGHVEPLHARQVPLPVVSARGPELAAHRGKAEAAARHLHHGRGRPRFGPRLVELNPAQILLSVPAATHEQLAVHFRGSELLSRRDERLELVPVIMHTIQHPNLVHRVGRRPLPSTNAHQIAPATACPQARHGALKSFLRIALAAHVSDR
mmetsp:Transcript_1069/g.2763  ORF Transcript_1069/g.2763 Transcript_1069/m.2763 type:complete len:274 (-) Transcript_1069:1474-2295(-)